MDRQEKHNRETERELDGKQEEREKKQTSIKREPTRLNRGKSKVKAGLLFALLLWERPTETKRKEEEEETHHQQ
jgi:hypothetical protein